MTKITEAAIYSDNEFNGKIDGFDIMSIKVRVPSRTTQAPIETGETSTDYKVLMPIHISVSGFVDTTTIGGMLALKKIYNMAANKEHEFYSVATKEGLYDNLILQDCPHDEDPDHVEVIQFHLEYIEALIVQGESSKSASGDNSNTKQRGFTSAS